MKKLVLLIFLSTNSFNISSEPPDAAEALKSNLKSIVGGAIVTGITLTTGYQILKEYGKQSQENPTNKQEEDQANLEQKDQQKENIKVSPTLRERLEFFGKGIGNGLICVASVVAAYKCATYSMDRVDFPDPIADCHDVYERSGEPKVGPEWDADIKNARLLKAQYIISSIPYGSLAIGISYLVTKNRVPQKALDYLKKAFQ